MPLRLATLALALSACAATADLVAQFEEGAPKDRFTLTNTGACPLGPMREVIDIGTAPAGLIFDTTGSGAGVSVYQPFDLTEGTEVVRSTPRVIDGDTAIALDLGGLGVDQRVSFTIDVDDTGGSAPTIISGSEIAGAALRSEGVDGVQSASFGSDASARLTYNACLS